MQQRWLPYHFSRFRTAIHPRFNTIELNSKQNKYVGRELLNYCHFCYVLEPAPKTALKPTVKNSSRLSNPDLFVLLKKITPVQRF